MNLDFRSVLIIVLGVALIVVGIITLSRAKKYVPKDRLFFNRWGIFLLGAGIVLAELPLIARCGNACIGIFESFLFVISLLMAGILLFTGVFATIFAFRLREERWRRIGIRVIGVFAILASLYMFALMAGWI